MHLISVFILCLFKNDYRHFKYIFLLRYCIFHPEHYILASKMLQKDEYVLVLIRNGIWSKGQLMFFNCEISALPHKRFLFAPQELKLDPCL